tara:strand:+ start:409 stop:600 length:192 start_codon:yes stop_codon:yes gene_type:complete
MDNHKKRRKRKVRNDLYHHMEISVTFGKEMENIIPLTKEELEKQQKFLLENGDLEKDLTISVE